MSSFFLVLSPAAKETMKRHFCMVKKESRGSRGGVFIEIVKHSSG
jgi:hypothetical protein